MPANLPRDSRPADPCVVGPSATGGHSWIAPASSSRQEVPRPADHRTSCLSVPFCVQPRQRSPATSRASLLRRQALPSGSFLTAATPFFPKPLAFYALLEDEETVEIVDVVIDEDWLETLGDDFA